MLAGELKIKMKKLLTLLLEIQAIKTKGNIVQFDVLLYCLSLVSYHMNWK